jgi:hypothetical protein
MSIKKPGKLGWMACRQEVATSSDRLETGMRNEFGQELSDAHHRRVAVAAADK